MHEDARQRRRPLPADAEPAVVLNPRDRTLHRPTLPGAPARPRDGPSTTTWSRSRTSRVPGLRAPASGDLNCVDGLFVDAGAAQLWPLDRDRRAALAEPS